MPELWNQKATIPLGGIHFPNASTLEKIGGPGRDRTDDLFHAEMLQISFGLELSH